MNMHSWQALTTSKVLRVFFTIVLVTFWTACADDSQNLKGPDADAASAVKKTKMDKPTISCSLSTQVSINVTVTMPPGTGAPSGFSIQWMTLADYTQNGGWYASDDPKLCKASFAGSAKDSRYVIPKEGGSVTVTIGELLFDNGTSTNCPDGLECETEYVFHTFAHASSTLQRSDWSNDITCSTLPCGHEESCTLTQGYWKTHGSIGPASCANVTTTDEFGVETTTSVCTSTWPVTSLTLGTVSYTEAQIQSILDTPASGNGLLTLAHQLIAAKLNVANGADPSAAASSIAAADTMIGSLKIPPVGSGFLKPGATSLLVTALTNYNEGATGPGHCD